MSEPASFFTTQLNFRRVLRTAFVLCLFPTVAAFFYVGDSYERIFWILFLSVLGYCVSRIRARHVRIPELKADQGAFSVRLPSALPYLFFHLILSDICILLCLFAVPILQDSDMRDLGALNPQISLLPLILLIGALLLILWYLCFQGTVLSISQNAGNLSLRYCHKNRQFPLQGLRVKRICGVGGKDVIGLELSLNESDKESYLSGHLPGERIFLKQLSNWLAEQGVQIENHEEIIPASSARIAFYNILDALIIITFVMFMHHIVISFSFWREWFFEGTISIFVLLFALLWGFPLGALLMLTPLRFWVWRLILFPWFRRLSPGDCHVVELVDGSCSGSILESRCRLATMQIKERVLEFQWGREKSTIERDSITETKRLGYLSSLKISDIARCSRFAKVDWVDVSGVGHRLYYRSFRGWTSGRNRSLDRKFFETIEKWRRGEEFQSLEKHSCGPQWLGIMIAALFLFVGLTIAPVHNHFIRNYIYTGLLLPPLGLQPEGNLYPVNPHDLEAAHTGALLFQEESSETGFFALSSRHWMGDPLTGNYRAFPLDAFRSIHSHPGKITHLFSLERFSMNLELSPFWSFYDYDLEDYPAQIQSVATGKTINITSMPESYYAKYFSPFISLGMADIALYHDEKIFYSNWIEKRHDTMQDFGWIDVRLDKWHPVGRIDTSRDLSPVFFPGGRHVLYAWHTIDLDTGEMTSLTLPLGEDEWADLDWAQNRSMWETFPVGERLRMAIYVYKTTETLEANLSEEQKERFESHSDDDEDEYYDEYYGENEDEDRDVDKDVDKDEDEDEDGVLVDSESKQLRIWEIDPLEGRIESIARFPKSIVLKSVDVDRWLMTDYITSGSKVLGVLKLHDHATSQTRTLGSGLKGYYRLIAGDEERMLHFSDEKGCTIVPIPQESPEDSP